jgi:hypothetical protein
MRIRIRRRAVASVPAYDAIHVFPARIRVTHRPMRILDFDIENRPLSYWYDGQCTGEITAIAWAWTDKPDVVTSVMLGETDPVDMLLAFVEQYNAADMVTGHFITGHDLGHINAALMEYQMPLLRSKMVQDTKMLLPKSKGMSGSQENLAAMLLLEHDKVKMDQTKWRDANRLTKEGIEKSRKRVEGDVKQHMEMRLKLMELGYLGAPKLWTGKDPVEGYTP